MTSYDGQTITYDAIGNPLKYRDNMSMKWNQGRQLTTLQLGLNTINYTYGEDGLRTKKLVNGLDSNYIRDDSGRLICYKTSIGTGHAMWFYYNPGSTTPDSIVFDGNRYVYFKNVQGDILGIVDKDGNLVAAYDYDSWGKCVHVYDGHLNVNTDYNFIGNINPLRYRGYEYDAESGLYYLQSRYYDPTTGRFVNCDYIVNTPQGLTGINTFVYCGNNPINRCDPTGTSWEYDGNTYDYAMNTTDFRRAEQGLPPMAYEIAKASGAAVIGSQTVNLGKGWTGHVDDGHVQGEKRHAHLFENKKEVANQDEDGNIIHPNKNTKSPPKKVKVELKKQTGWDWDANCLKASAMDLNDDPNVKFFSGNTNQAIIPRIGKLPSLSSSGEGVPIFSGEPALGY